MHNIIVRPDNFLGIELNPRAAAIAQIVLWIGYFQFHRRATGKADTNDRPLLPKHNTIECRDAVLAYDAKIPRRDPETGDYVTIWDGRTTKTHPVTGKEVPNETARTNLFDYSNPKRAEWPRADYIVGNPPFIGVRKLIGALSESYVYALRKAYPDVPETTDLVGYWWHRAAELVEQKKLQRFGLITTNSITQEYSRRILDQHLESKRPVSLLYAISDHPWVDTVDGASVRVAMHVVGRGKVEGKLVSITDETPDESEPGTSAVHLHEVQGKISSKLTILGENGKPVSLKANGGTCFQGIVPAGSGFKLSTTSHLLREAEFLSPNGPIKPYLIGKDLVQRHEPKFIIDCFGMTSKQVQSKYPAIYQHLLLSVKPERDQNRRESYRDKWWIFAEPRPAMRAAIKGLSRFIGTPYTAKYRPFIFVDASIIPDAMVYAIASDDAAILGYLSSSLHSTWSKWAGGTLEDRPRYNSNGTFLPFPFPAIEEGHLKQRIRDLGERLDAHRKARQAAHPDLTLTGMYNVLEKLRAGEPLTDKERKIHDDGLVTLLKQIHDDLDEAVLEAYGWADLEAPHSCGARECTDIEKREALPNDPPFTSRQECRDSLLLTRLVALNHERAAEERAGQIRWLRPASQCPAESSATNAPEESPTLPGTDIPPSSPSKIKNQKPVPAKRSGDGSTIINQSPWPKATPAQFSAVTHLLPTTGPDAEAISATFGRKSKTRGREIEEILETLKSLGKLE